jgi:Cu/Ag efflux protein CusF
MKHILTHIAIPLVVLAGPAQAADPHAGHAGMQPATTPQPASAPLSEGTVKRVNKPAGKLTIAHGPLENLGMPPMTMAFLVQDKAMLDRVKVGDKVRFRAEQTAGGYTVTQLEAAK